MSDAQDTRTVALDDLAVVMDRIWQRMVEFPMPRMCKHFAADIVIQEMEELGIEPPADIVRAVVFAHDDISLAWKRDASPTPAPSAQEAV